MGDLSKMSDGVKVAFLMQALYEAGELLRLAGYAEEGTRYAGYVREMQGPAQVKEPSP